LKALKKRNIKKKTDDLLQGFNETFFCLFLLGGFFNEDESFRAYKAVNDKNNEKKRGMGNRVSVRVLPRTYVQWAPLNGITVNGIKGLMESN
jgi:hypothetical protein